MRYRCTEHVTARERFWVADCHGVEYSLDVSVTHECVSNHDAGDGIHQCDFCGYRWDRKYKEEKI